MKSNVRELTDFCECILKDAYAKCFTDQVNFTRDLKTIKSRVENEGISFLTITLPNFGQAFERSLEESQVTPHEFPGWKRHASLPSFLKGLMRLVFSADTGGLLDVPSLAAVEGIRQIAFTFKKLSLPCTPERESMALRGFKEIEHFLSSAMLPRDTDLFCEISTLLWNAVFVEDYDPLRYVPKHGPGQTAERISGNRKYAQRTWTERLEPFFPSDSFIMSCFSQLDDENDGISGVKFVRHEDELPVRVCLVPKTLKGPRIIAIEPVCMQYTQQALSRYILDKLARSKITGGHINFTDQSVNQEFAISASRDKSYATLDLSSASDRVPLTLASRMLESRLDLRDAILACRSESAILPNGEVLPSLKKFASMGSALCFPIESMYFFTVILTALFREAQLPVTLRNIKKLSRRVYVYGDDIIIPVDKVSVVTETLTDFYCRVNIHKSFWKGFFRESCGMDAFQGECVTPTYLRETRPSNKGSVAGLVSWVATRNLFYKKGYWVTAAHMVKHVESILGRLPNIEENSPALGWISFLKGYSFERWNRKLHRFEVHAYVSSPLYQKDPLGNWSALLKYFLNAGKERKSLLSCDERHLSRSPRSGTSSIKRRWTTPY